MISRADRILIVNKVLLNINFFTVKNMRFSLLVLGIMTALSGCQKVAVSELKEQFRNPSSEYRPVAATIRNGASEDIIQKLNVIYNVHGFGGIMFEPTTNKKSEGGFKSTSPSFRHAMGGLQNKHVKGQSPWVMISPPGTRPSGVIVLPDLRIIRTGPPGSPDTVSISAIIPDTSPSGIEIETPPEPAYMSREWFDHVKKILAYTKESGHKAVFYDEVGYPSGMANHTTPKEFYRKILEKNEDIKVGPIGYEVEVPKDGTLIAAVAMNVVTLERIDLTSMINVGKLKWNVPAGEWRIMIFNCRTSEAVGESNDYNAVTDYLDPDAVKWFLNTVYDPLCEEIGEYFGNTVFQTFYDDVGIYNQEKTWTYKFNDKFRELTGKDPGVYYPALWYNIGPETESARVAFFNTRAELLADGFPKVLTDWGAEHNLQISGHAPGNYEIQPVDMCGDPFKFDRAQPIPMVDVIFNYPFGRDGFKLASDGGDLYDKPIVSAETFSSFLPAGTIMGYRRAMELYIRGINRFTGCGFARSNNRYVDKYSTYDIIGDSSLFAEWAGRLSFLLQGGRRVSEIAILYPIAALQAHFYFDAPENTLEMRWGTFVPYESDYLAVGEMLLNQVHRDFTFVHPDILSTDRIRVNGNSLELINKVNHQSYKLLILPGQRVISLKALEKIKEYFEAGGSIIATSLLPSKAAELPANDEEAAANDLRIQSIIEEIFGIDPSKPMLEGITEIITNTNNGKAVFISKPDSDVLAQMLGELGIDPDVAFSDNPVPSSGGGAFSYIHKVKNDLNIYLFANSTDEAINTYAEIRGKIRPEKWDPYNGETTRINDVEYIKKEGKIYTRFPLKLESVSSVFVTGK